MSVKMEVSNDSFIEENSILFREKEVNFLTEFLEKKSSSPYRPLFIYGETATGKTLILYKLLKYLSKKFVWINCYKYSSAVQVFTAVLQNLSKNKDQKGINNVCQFINNLKQELKDITETVYLIFDSAEVYRKDSSIIPVLTRLQSITKANISPIFISRLSWDEFIDQNTTYRPVSIFFPNYSKIEMGELLCLDCPPKCTQTFYAGYVNIILKTFFTMVRNLTELRKIADENFARYCEPLLEDPLIEPSMMRLWKNIEPSLKLAMNFMYLREPRGSVWKAYKNANHNRENKMLLDLDRALPTRELSYFTKFLLVSAYFASFNSQQSDFKHFVKNQGKQDKKKSKKKLGKNRHLLGPKPFTLDRMISIFRSLVGQQVTSPALIYCQMSSLVNHHLISRVSVDEKIEGPTFKCLADLKLVCRIGKTIGIDVMGYLDDFL